MIYPDDSMAGRILAGEKEAIAELNRWIYRLLALPRFRSLRSDRLDLRQEIIARVLESLRRGRFDPAQDLHAYVHGVGRYVALEALRHNRPGCAQAPDRNIEYRQTPDPDQMVIDRELVRRALECAPPPCRDLIRSYFFEQQDYAAIAASTGLAIGTVKSRLFRCLDAMRLAVTGRVRCSAVPGARPGSNGSRPAGCPALAAHTDARRA